MKLYLNANQYIDTTSGVDLSIPVVNGENNVNAWYCDPVRISPVIAGDFIGEIASGSPVNFRNIALNPHGNGTHTECVGHIAAETYTINQCLKEFHFMARLISVHPTDFWNEEFQQMDQRIEAGAIQENTENWANEQALIIRTLENPESKKKFYYSGTNPIYFSVEAIDTINALGVKHLLVDLPSVDREKDNGLVLCHKRFWNYPAAPQTDKTISELLYIPNHLPDGIYLIHLQIMSLENDASPSKIMAHKIHQTT